jgi:outer membrane biosynthesis protein TonB
MVAAFLRFDLPAEADALAAATRALGLVPCTGTPLLTDRGAPAPHANGQVREVEQTAQTPEPARRGPGRPRKVVAAEPQPLPEAEPAPAPQPEPAPAPLPAPEPEVEPETVPYGPPPAPPAAEVITKEREAALRADVSFQAARVARAISLPAMRGVLQTVAGDHVMSVSDVPPEFLVGALTALRAVD